MSILIHLRALSFALTLNGAAIALCTVLERRRPARPQPGGARILNLLLGATFVILQPTLAMLTIFGVNSVGGGLIALPGSGLGLLVSIPVFFLTNDFAEYVFHRAQHAIPFLWSMHSLHHSDRAYNATTALRAYWFEPALKSVTIWLAVGMLFKPTPLVLFAYTAGTLYNYMIHANARIHYGRFSWLLNAPAYHRIHHSASEEHYNSNYAALFPIFDVIAGAYCPPPRETYPPTGLGGDDCSISLWQAIVWPFRKTAAKPSALAQKA